MSDEEGSRPPERLGDRLDPDAAARARSGEPATEQEPASAPAQAIDTRRYRWAIGGLGITLVIVLSVYQFATHGVGTSGVTAGARLHAFSAPLAASSLNGDANANPPCDASRHDSRAVNICLLERSSPLVIVFFVAGADTCVRGVTTVDRALRALPAGRVRAVAVAVNSGHRETADLVRRHRWRLAVAYDRDGAIGQQYGVAVCPLLELAHPGGVVAERLIGERWLSEAALAPHLRALVGAPG